MKDLLLGNMAQLVVMLTTGKGTWAETAKLINAEEWEHVYIITNDFGKQKFSCNKPHSFILINNFDSVEDIKTKIYNDLNQKLMFDVGVNFVSGTGKEHMALMAALFKLGVGIRIVDSTGKEV